MSAALFALASAGAADFVPVAQAEDWTAPGGRWRIDPLADLANPTGGLGGDLAVVNVANGAPSSRLPSSEARSGAPRRRLVGATVCPGAASRRTGRG